MLTDAEKDTIRTVLGQIKAKLPEYKSRRAQREMLGAVARVLGNARGKSTDKKTGTNFLVCEAGTGTGKSHALGCSSIVVGHFLKKKVVFSSSTVALQEQLVAKDLPFLQSALPFPINIALAKGRQRYVCPMKLAIHQRVGNEDISLGQREFSSAEYDTLGTMAELLVAKEWSGDKDSLTIPMTPGLWNSVTSDRHGCAGTKCPSYEQCPFYTARNKLQSADVIVANHDLVLAALVMDPGSVLPDPADCLIIFDEAHTVPDKVSEHFAARHTVRGAAQWSQEIGPLSERLCHTAGVNASNQTALHEKLRNLANALGSLYAILSANPVWGTATTLRLPHGIVPEAIATLGENVLNCASRTLAILSQMRDELLQNLAGNQKTNQALLGELGVYIGRIETVAGTWDLMMKETAATEAPIAKWFERNRNGEIIACATPISAATSLENLLWSKAAAVVMASATLTACGEFKLFLEATGLNKYTGAEVMALDSPFDYAAQAQLIVPRMKYSPEQADKHTEEIIYRLPRLITTLGTLVLYTSGAQMKAVFAGIPDDLRADVLLQGDLSKGEILKRHRERIAAGQRSIIFGLASFAEGIDLPGNECETVIIAKLPFSQPTDPIQAAKVEWIERNGGSAFADLVLPEAGVKLAQMVGRLIRRESDTGRVIILDKRLGTKRYGKQLLAGLPPFRLELFGRGQPAPQPSAPTTDADTKTAEPLAVFRNRYRGRAVINTCAPTETYLSTVSVDNPVPC